MTTVAPFSRLPSPPREIAGSLVLDTHNLLLRGLPAPEDAIALQAPALRLTEITLRGPQPEAQLPAWEALLKQQSCALVTCRLPCDDLRRSFLLERFGFRFIETNYRPEISAPPITWAESPPPLTVQPPTREDWPAVEQIAEIAFRHERFHVDPRLGPALGGARYRRWVKSCRDHPTQRLTVLKDGAKLVAFFITEGLEQGTEYWHLNAVNPSYQGQGYGRAAWRTMCARAFANGAERIRTCVSCRNHQVLGLYAMLGARLGPPDMTFHWIREGFHAPAADGI